MDPIADMIVRIKNASDSKKESVVFPYSKLKLAILDALLKEGFVKLVDDVVHMGDVVKAKVIHVDTDGHIRLSLKRMNE